jgi:hypothetical protein
MFGDGEWSQVVVGLLYDEVGEGGRVGGVCSGRLG